MKKSIAPTFRSEIFDCPHCSCRTRHEWVTAYKNGENVNVVSEKSYEDWAKKSHLRMGLDNDEFDTLPRITDFTVYRLDWEFNISVCTTCGEYMLWRNGNAIYPTAYSIEDPNADMPEDIKNLYDEARAIVRLSPKSACALLRLALERLLIHLGCSKNKRLVENIEGLRETGKIHEFVYDAMQSVRLVGNKSVHPGLINVDDDPKYAYTLFGLLNYIVDEMISREIRIKEFRNSLG